jgi:hypothetical protein
MHKPRCSPMLCAQAHISGGLVARSSSSGVDVVAAEEQVQGGTIHYTLRGRGRQWKWKALA